MSNDDILTDDYVAGLLAEEAKDCSLKYSALGMEAFRSNKKPANMPKPNTRFLRHIIKDTNTHNKALLAKEAAESRARLKHLEQAEEAKRLKTNPNSKDIRRRQMGDIHAILGGTRRRRTENRDAEAGTGSRHRDTAESSKHRSSSKHQDLFADRSEDEKKHRARLSRTDERSSRDKTSRSEGKHRSRRHHEAESASDDERRRHHSRRTRERSRSRSPRRRHRSRSPKEGERRHRHRSPVQAARKPSVDRREENDDDSDPLEDLIGPAPPPRYRGRGKLGGAAGIDRRFSDSYDPKLDVQMDDDGDVAGDWDDAVEAFRDRQKLKQNQEQRMKEAGFAPQQIAKLHEEEALEDNVKWSKSGEKRQWDVGKSIGPDGNIVNEV